MEEKRAKWQNKSRKPVKLLNGYVANPGEPFIANRSDIPDAFLDFFEQIKVEYQPPQADAGKASEGSKRGGLVRTRTNSIDTTADDEQRIAEQIQQELSLPVDEEKEPVYVIRFVSAGWYDVIDVQTEEVMNVRKLRKPQAEEMCLQLNHPEE